MFFDNAVLDATAKGSLLSTLGLIWIVHLVRIVGLRLVSKMTNFNFVRLATTHASKMFRQS